MTNTTYTRPTNTYASFVGRMNRSKWTRTMRCRVQFFDKPNEYYASEESIKESLRRPNDARPLSWVTVRLRVEHLALLDMFQKKHLKANGKEIGRPKVMAALMTNGMDAILKHPDFSLNNEG